MTANGNETLPTAIRVVVKDTATNRPLRLGQLPHETTIQAIKETLRSSHGDICGPDDEMRLESGGIALQDDKSLGDYLNKKDSSVTLELTVLHPEDGWININVNKKTPSGGPMGRFRIPIQPSSTIYEIKTEIQQTVDISRDVQKLSFLKRTLKDDSKTAEQCDIKEGCELEVELDNPAARKIILIGDEDTLRKVAKKARLGRSYSLRKNLVGKEDTLSEKALLEKIKHRVGLGQDVSLFSVAEADNSFTTSPEAEFADEKFFIQHPDDDCVYVPVHNYSKILAKEKDAAFYRLARALGAKKIELYNGQVVTAKGKVKAGVKEAVDVGINAHFEKYGGLAKGVYLECRRPPKDAQIEIPSDLERWIVTDKAFRMMKEGRDQHGSSLAKQRVTLEFQSASGFGGEAAVKIANKGLSVGGSYQAISHSVWEFEVEYFDLSESNSQTLGDGGPQHRADSTTLQTEQTSPSDRDGRGRRRRRFFKFF